MRLLIADVLIVFLSQNNAELTRRSEDTSRAYDQEKKVGVCVVAI